uniref:Uncharacterized protein n=1 Tax=Clytia hemisphaerica TaxID=252671 RepID=A0A7M5WUK1_9CNID
MKKKMSATMLKIWFYTSLLLFVAVASSKGNKRNLGSPHDLPDILKNDKVDANDLKYATDDFRVDTHPNQGVIIESEGVGGPHKKSQTRKSKDVTFNKRHLGMPRDLPDILKNDKVDANDLKYATDDFRVDTHPNQGVIIESEGVGGSHKKSQTQESKDATFDKRQLGSPRDLPDILKNDKVDANDLKYATDDFRVDTHPNQGVIIESEGVGGPHKKSQTLQPKKKGKEMTGVKKQFDTDLNMMPELPLVGPQPEEHLTVEPPAPIEPIEPVHPIEPVPIEPMPEPIISHVSEPVPIIQQEPPPIVHHEEPIIHHEPVLLPVPIAAPAPPPPPPCTVHIPVTVHLKGKLAIKMKHCQKCDFSKNIESIGPLKISSLNQLEDKLKERLDKSFKVNAKRGGKKRGKLHKAHHKKSKDIKGTKRDHPPVIDYDRLDRANERFIFGSDGEEGEETDVQGSKKDQVDEPGQDAFFRKAVNIPKVFIPSAAYKRGVIISLPKGKAMLKCVVPKDENKKSSKKEKIDDNSSFISFVTKPTVAPAREKKIISPSLADFSNNVEPPEEAAPAIASFTKTATEKESPLPQSGVSGVTKSEDTAVAKDKQDVTDTNSDVVTLSTEPAAEAAPKPQANLKEHIESAIQNIKFPSTEEKAPKAGAIQQSSISEASAANQPSPETQNKKFADNFMKVLDKDMLVSLYKMAVHDIMSELQNAKTVAHNEETSAMAETSNLQSKMKMISNERTALEQQYPGIAATLIAPPDSAFNMQQQRAVKRSETPSKRVKLIDTDRPKIRASRHGNIKQFVAADESGFFGDLDPSKLIDDHEKDCIEPTCQKQKDFMKGASKYFESLDSLALAPYQNFMGKTLQNKRESIEVGQTQQPSTIVELFGKLPRVPLKITLNPKGPLAKLKEPITIDLKPPDGKRSNSRAVAITNNPAIAVTIADRIFKDEPMTKEDQNKLQAAYADLRRRTLETPHRGKEIHLTPSRIEQRGKRMRIVVSLPKELTSILSGNQGSAATRAMTSTSTAEAQQQSPEMTESSLKPKILEYENTLDKLKKETKEAMLQLNRLKDPYSDIGQKRHHHHQKHHQEQKEEATKTKMVVNDPYADVGGLPARRKRRRATDEVEVGAILPNKEEDTYKYMTKKESYEKLAKDPYATMGSAGLKRSFRAVSNKAGTKRGFFDDASHGGTGGMSLISHTHTPSMSTVDSTASALEQITAANNVAPREAPSSPHTMMLDSLPKFKEALAKINPETRKRLFEMKPFRFLANMPNIDSAVESSTQPKKPTLQTFDNGRDPYGDMGAAVARSQTYSKKGSYKRDPYADVGSAPSTPVKREETHKKPGPSTSTKRDPYADLGSAPDVPTKRTHTNKRPSTKGGYKRDPYADVGNTSGMPSKRTQTSKGYKKSGDPFADIGYGSEVHSKSPSKLDKAQTKSLKPLKKINKIHATIKKDPFADIGNKRHKLPTKVNQKKGAKRERKTSRKQVSKRGKVSRKNKKSKRSRMPKHSKKQKRQKVIGRPKKTTGHKRDPFSDIGSAPSEPLKGSTFSKKNHKKNVKNEKRSRMAKLSRRKNKITTVKSRASITKTRLAPTGIKASLKSGIVSKAGLKSKFKAVSNSIVLKSINARPVKGSKRKLEETSPGADGNQETSVYSRDDAEKKEQVQVTDFKKIAEKAKLPTSMENIQGVKSYAKDPYKSIGKVLPPKIIPGDQKPPKDDEDKDDSKKKKEKSKEFAKADSEEGDHGVQKKISGKEVTKAKEFELSEETSKESGKDLKEGATNQKQVHLLGKNADNLNIEGNTQPESSLALEAQKQLKESFDTHQIASTKSEHQSSDPYADVGESSKFWGEKGDSDSKSNIDDKSVTGKTVSNVTQNMAGPASGSNATLHMDPRLEKDVSLADSVLKKANHEEGDSLKKTNEDETSESKKEEEDKEEGEEEKGAKIMEKVKELSDKLKEGNEKVLKKKKEDQANLKGQDEEGEVDQALAKTEELLRALNKSNAQIKNEMNGVSSQTLSKGDSTQTLSQDPSSDPYANLRHKLPETSEEQRNSAPKSNSTQSEKTSKGSLPVFGQQAIASKVKTNAKNSDPYLEIGASSPNPSKRAKQEGSKNNDTSKTQEFKTNQKSVNQGRDPYLDVGESVTSTVATKRSRDPTKTPLKAKINKRSRRAAEITKRFLSCSEPYEMIGSEASKRDDDCNFVNPSKVKESKPLTHYGDPYTDLGSKRAKPTKPHTNKRTKTTKRPVVKKAKPVKRHFIKKRKSVKRHTISKKNHHHPASKKHIITKKAHKRVYLPQHPAEVSNAGRDQVEPSIFQGIFPLLMKLKSPESKDSKETVSNQINGKDPYSDIGKKRNSMDKHPSKGNKKSMNVKAVKIDPYADIGRKRDRVDKATTKGISPQHKLTQPDDLEDKKYYKPDTLVGSVLADDRKRSGVAANQTKSAGNVIKDPYVLIGSAVDSQKRSETQHSNQTKAAENKNIIKDPYVLIGSAVDDQKRSEVISNETKVVDNKNIIKDPYVMIGSAVDDQKRSDVASNQTKAAENKNIIKDPYVFIGSAVNDQKRSDVASNQTKAAENKNIIKDPYVFIGSAVNDQKRSDVASNQTKAAENKNIIKDPYVFIGSAVNDQKRSDVASNETKSASNKNIVKDPYVMIGSAVDDQKRSDVASNETKVVDNKNTIKDPYVLIGSAVNDQKRSDVASNQTNIEKARQKLLKDPYLFIGSAVEKKSVTKNHKRYHSTKVTKRSFDPYADLGTAVGLTQNEARHEKTAKGSESVEKLAAGEARASETTAKELESLHNGISEFTRASQSHIGPYDTSDPYVAKAKSEGKEAKLKAKEKKKFHEKGKAVKATPSVAEELNTIENLEKAIATEKSKVHPAVEEDEDSLSKNVGKEVKRLYSDIGGKKRSSLSSKRKSMKHPSRKSQIDKSKCKKRHKEVQIPKALKDPYVMIGTPSEDSKRQEIECAEYEDDNLKNAMQGQSDGGSKLDDKTPESQGNTQEENKENSSKEGGSKEENKEDASKQESPSEDASKQENPKEDASKQENPKEDASKQENPKEDTSKQESPKEENTKSESANEEKGQQEGPKDGQSNGNDQKAAQEANKENDSKQESSKEFSKEEGSKEDSPKQDESKDQATAEQGPTQDNSDAPEQNSSEEGQKQNEGSNGEAVKQESGSSDQGAKQEGSSDQGPKEESTDQGPKEGSTDQGPKEGSTDQGAKQSEDATKENAKEEHKEDGAKEENSKESEGDKTKEMLAKEEQAKMAAKEAEAAYSSINNFNSDSSNGNSGSQDAQQQGNGPSGNPSSDSAKEGENAKQEGAKEENKEGGSTKEKDSKEVSKLIENNEKNQQEGGDTGESPQKQNSDTTADKDPSKAENSESTSEKAKEDSSSKGVSTDSLNSNPSPVEDASKPNPVDESKAGKEGEKESGDKASEENKQQTENGDPNSNVNNEDMTDYLMGRLTSDSTGTHYKPDKPQEQKKKTEHAKPTGGLSKLESAYASTGSSAPDRGDKKHSLHKYAAGKNPRDPYADMGQVTRSNIPSKPKDNFVFLKVEDKPLDDVSLTL